MRSVLRTPGVMRIYVLSCVARLPLGALGLLLVLHTQALTGSYAKGGVAAGAYLLALGVSNPVLARAVDRRGQTLVLQAGAVVCASAITAVALLPHGAPFAFTLAGAAIAGAAQPPVAACMRTLWPSLLKDPNRLHAAYSLDSVATEIVYISGPVVIVAGIGSLSLRAAMVTCAAFVLFGDLGFSVQRLSRDWRPTLSERPRLAGALTAPGVRVLLVALALAGLALGAVEVAVPAVMKSWGHGDLTGLMLGVWGVGSMLGGLATGRAGAAARPARLLSILLVAWSVTHASVGLGQSPLAVALLLLVAGATIAPVFVCANGMLDHLAPTGSVTEAFTWLSTGLSAGLAGGSALAGALVDNASPEVALGACAVGGLVAAGIVALGAERPLAVAPAEG